MTFRPDAMVARRAPVSPQQTAGRTTALSADIVGFALLALAIVALVLAWPYLQEEHRRMEPWRIALVYAGDIVVAFWFINWWVSRLVWGPSREPPRRRARSAILAIGTMLLGIGIDGYETWHAMRVERDAYARAVVTEASLYAGTREEGPDDIWYLLHARFNDARGEPREASIRLWHPKGGPFPPGLRKPPSESMRDFQYPFPADVRYDPLWPSRCWIEGQGAMNGAGRRLYDWMMMSTILQGVASVLSIAALFNMVADARAAAESGASGGELRGDLELFKLYPFAAHVMAMFVMAIATRGW